MLQLFGLVLLLLLPPFFLWVAEDLLEVISWYCAAFFPSASQVRRCDAGGIRVLAVRPVRYVPRAHQTRGGRHQRGQQEGQRRVVFFPLMVCCPRIVCRVPSLIFFLPLFKRSSTRVVYLVFLCLVVVPPPVCEKSILYTEHTKVECFEYIEDISCPAPPVAWKRASTKICVVCCCVSCFVLTRRLAASHSPACTSAWTTGLS